MNTFRTIAITILLVAFTIIGIPFSIAHANEVANKVFYKGELGFVFSEYELSIAKGSSIEVNRSHPPPTAEEIALAYIRARSATDDCIFVNKFRCEIRQVLPIGDIFEDVHAVKLHGCIKNDSDGTSGARYFCRFDLRASFQYDDFLSMSQGPGRLLLESVKQGDAMLRKRTSSLTVAEFYMSEKGWMSPEFVMQAKRVAMQRARVISNNINAFSCNLSNMLNSDWQEDKICSTAFTKEELIDLRKSLLEEERQKKLLEKKLSYLENQGDLEFTSFNPNTIAAFAPWANNWVMRPYGRLYTGKYIINNDSAQHLSEIKKIGHLARYKADQLKVERLPFYLMWHSELGEIVMLTTWRPRLVGSGVKRNRLYQTRIELAARSDPELAKKLISDFNALKEKGVDLVEFPRGLHSEKIAEFMGIFDSDGKTDPLSLADLPPTIALNIAKDDNYQEADLIAMKHYYGLCESLNSEMLLECGCVAVEKWRIHKKFPWLKGTIQEPEVPLSCLGNKEQLIETMKKTVRLASLYTKEKPEAVPAFFDCLSDAILAESKRSSPKINERLRSAKKICREVFRKI